MSLPTWPLPRVWLSPGIVGGSTFHWGIYSTCSETKQGQSCFPGESQGLEAGLGRTFHLRLSVCFPCRTTQIQHMFRKQTSLECCRAHASLCLPESAVSEN